MKKIFFTDLDGTLLNKDKLVTPKTHEALEKWLALGNILAVSSGRPLGSILEVVRRNEIGYDSKTDTFHPNLLTIAFNGALTYHPKSNAILDQVVLEQNSLGRIASIAKSHGVYCHTYDEEYILAPYAGPELEFYRRSVHLPYKVLSDFPNSITNPPCKFLCICLELTDPDRLLEVARDIMAEFPDTITCVKSSPYLLEVFSSASGKGSAVTKLCQKLQIDIKHSFAAGDEENDISMLKAAGLGIAMKNASDKVKQEADIITEFTNNEDGLADIFRTNC